MFHIPAYASRSLYSTSLMFQKLFISKKYIYSQNLIFPKVSLNTMLPSNCISKTLCFQTIQCFHNTTVDCQDLMFSHHVFLEPSQTLIFSTIRYFLNLVFTNHDVPRSLASQDTCFLEPFFPRTLYSCTGMFPESPESLPYQKKCFPKYAGQSIFLQIAHIP